MKVIEKKCSMCGSPIYVYEDCVREEMFCTLHCMECASFSKVSRPDNSFLTSSDSVTNV